MKSLDEYLRDVAASVQYVRENPSAKSRGNAAMYGMIAKVPFRGMVKTGVEPVPHQEIIEVTAMLYAGAKSMQEKGRLVELKEVMG